MRVAFVVQRYGAEVAGGAEALCRDTARALVRGGEEVTVFTTTARDYLSWEPFYPAGARVDDGVVVRRFAVDPPDPTRAADLVRRLALGVGNAALEAEWAKAQGPLSRDMLVALSGLRGPSADRSGQSDGYDAVACWTYLYATTQLAMPLVRTRTVLVPLAHAEPMLRFGLTRGVIRTASALAFMTPEERRLVEDAVGLALLPGVVVGAGIDPSPHGDADRARRTRSLPPRFALYLGRLDAAKGVDALVRAHAAYREAGGPLGLVLAGRAVPGMHVPDWVVTTGFISEEERADILDAAEVVVLPSAYESLSLVALEAWRAGRPTLGNAHSAVVAGQTARSAGGLLYTGPATYSRQLGRLAADRAACEAMGANGQAFAQALTWDACVERWRAVIALAQ